MTVGPVGAAGERGEPPRLSCRDVSVRFGGLLAVDEVSIAVPPDSIVGLVGPNGAGKSTLFGVLSGLLRPTAGRVFLDGEDVTRARPQQRSARGLARTFQHPELFGGLTVREHLVLAQRAKHARRRIWSDLFSVGGLRPTDAAERERVDELVDLLGLGDIADRPALGLPLGLARLVEIGRALATDPSVLLLDEPSSGLDVADTARFETSLRRVAHDRGISVLLVEHDVDLVMRVCSAVNVLDFGRLIASGPPDEVRLDPSVRAAYLGDQPGGDQAGGRPDTVPSGEETHLGPAAAEPTRPTGPGRGGVALEVERLSVCYGAAVALSDVSISLAAGEALAVLGPNGAGKSTLARALSGLVSCTAGRIELDGEDVTGWPAHRIRRTGVVHLPEGRGVFRALTVAENLAMAAAVVPSRRARNQAVERAIEVFPALARHRRRPAGLLSGGEQQMLSLARALSTDPTLLIADELSLGLAPMIVDVVFEGLVRIRDAGVTVVMIEQYVHRALGFADHCVVLQRGQVSWRGEASAAQDEVLRRYLGDGMIAAATTT